MQHTRLKKKLIFVGIIAISVWQYPFLALMMPDYSLGDIPLSLISILLIWILLIVVINVLINKKSVKSIVKEND